MVRKIKTTMMYSFWGILAGGVLAYVVLQLLSLLANGSFLELEAILWAYVMIAGILMVILGICSISLLRHEGFRLRNLYGPFSSLAWAAGNLITLIIAGYVRNPAWIGRFLMVYTCFMDLMVSGILMMAFLAAKHRPAYDKDFVIIPGCSISKQGGLLPLLKGRTNAAIRFAWDQERATEKPARYIPTGGQGPDEIMSEGSAMEFYLLSHGAEQYEVFPEKESVNTYENMLFSKKIIDAQLPHAKTCYVTTNYHVLRSGMLARRVGLDAEGLASTTKWYFWPNGLARELLGILSMYKIQQLAAVVICLAVVLLKLV